MNLLCRIPDFTPTSLHVNIFDTNDEQYTIPESVVSRPPPPTASFKTKSDLVFNYNPSPFAFWITRRSQPGGIPLFDTRTTSLPAVPTGPVIANDNSTVLSGFPLVFEKQYLQVGLAVTSATYIVSRVALQIASALPKDANVYGLGEVVASSGFRRNIGPDGGTIQTMWARDVADPVDQNE
jgi:alpha-glucosidase